jgi:hypothetical protein
MNTFPHDLRYATRTLLKARGFAFIAVLAARVEPRAALED